MSSKQKITVLLLMLLPPLPLLPLLLLLERPWMNDACAPTCWPALYCPCRSIAAKIARIHEVGTALVLPVVDAVATLAPLPCPRP